MAAVKKKTNQPKPASAADFRKADIASTKAFNKLAGTNAPAFPSGSVKSTTGLSGVGMNDIAAYLQKFGVGGGGGGGGSAGMSAADRAQIDLERRKLRSQNRQFNQELAFRQSEAAAEKQRLADTLARQQGGMDSYIQGLQGLIDAGPANKGLYDALTKLNTGAQTDITSAYNALDAALKGITNPFAGYETKAVSSPTAGLEQFLSSQGVGTDDLTRFAQLQQAQSQQQATAANNLMAQLGGLFTGAQQSRQAEAAMGRTADTNALAMNNLLMQAQLGQQGQSQMDELRKLLLQAQMQKAGL